MPQPLRTLLITPFFDTAPPSGGALPSMTTAGEWLRRGRQVAVVCTRRERQLGPLQNYADSGQLEIHAIATEEQVRFSHHRHAEVGAAATMVLRTFHPHGVHVHNFQGLLARSPTAQSPPARRDGRQWPARARPLAGLQNSLPQTRAVPLLVGAATPESMKNCQKRK
ncbi:MAG: hypothetical protein KA354_00030 [Phycisphaerae bacterium]|nr:hypothetical protein [Phycisphaerae bacterium]